MNHPCPTWGNAAAPMVKLLHTTNYIWVDPNTGVTWSGDRTRLYSHQNQTAGLPYQWSCSPLCSPRLTEAHGQWCCLGTNSTSSKGEGIFQMLGATGLVLTLSVSHAGLSISCGNKVWKGFPPNWSGQCGLGYLAPSATKYSTLNASLIANLSSFVHKIMPHKHTTCEIIENPLVYHNAKFFSVLRVLFPALEVMSWKVNLKSLHGNGRRGQPHHANFENTPVRD